MYVHTFCGQACDIVNFPDVKCFWQSSSAGGNDLQCQEKGSVS